MSTRLGGGLISGEELDEARACHAPEDGGLRDSEAYVHRRQPPGHHR